MIKQDSLYTEGKLLCPKLLIDVCLDWKLVTVQVDKNLMALFKFEMYESLLVETEEDFNICYTNSYCLFH